MTTNNQTQEILLSLKNLDAVQSEKVLNYIKGLMHVRQSELNHQKLKRKAMREISQALGQSMHLF